MSRSIGTRIILGGGALLLALSLGQAEEIARLTPTRMVSMVYPRPALLAGIQGSVEILCNVSVAGDVTEATALGGHPLLAKPAAANAKRWMFEMHGNQSVTTKLVYRFSLSGNGPPAPGESVFDQPNVITVSSAPIPLNPHSDPTRKKE